MIVFATITVVAVLVMVVIAVVAVMWGGVEEWGVGVKGIVMAMVLSAEAVVPVWMEMVVRAMVAVATMGGDPPHPPTPPPTLYIEEITVGWWGGEGGWGGSSHMRDLLIKPGN